MDKSIAVRFDNVSFSYSDVRVLEDASFHIHQGEFAAMVGPNGSGKTTVLKLLLGLEKPDCGNINICDSTAYVSQQIPSDNQFPITVRGIVRMGLLHPFKRYIKNDETVNEALRITGIFDIAARPYSALSGGQKRRALVARALAAKPQFLVLDEPTANMDADSEEQLYKTLGAYKGKITILIVTHDTEYVTSLTDRVLCLGNGRKIVQHNTGKNDAVHHGGTGHEVRVLHEENITCC